MSREREVRDIDKERENYRKIQQIDICFFVKNKIMKMFRLSCKRFLDLELHIQVINFQRKFFLFLKA